MSKPQVLLVGELAWATPDLKDIIDPHAECSSIESKSREEAFKDFSPQGRYGKIKAIYLEPGVKGTIGPLNADFINALPESCKWIGYKGAGYDGVDVKACKARGIGMSNTPVAVDEATATTALYLIIGAIRRFYLCETTLRNGGFGFSKDQVQAKTYDLSGKTVGILGMGSIGSTLAGYLKPFGVKLIYHNRNPSPKATSDVEYVKDLDTFLAQVDVLSIHMPLNANTKHFMGERQLRTMKKGSILVNTARGGVIDQQALIKVLKDGHLGAAGLDVFEEEPKVPQELIDMDNVSLLPHVGTENQDARRKMEVVALTNIRDFLIKGKGEQLIPELQ